MKRPSIQLYPGDWLRDAIAGCSLAAQGLWLRIMFVMHDSSIYGKVSLPKDQLSRRCGCTPREFEKLFSELRAAGVPTLDEDGAIVSRRMVKDELVREQTAARQRKFYSEHNAKPNADPNAHLTVVSHPSSSSSSTSVSSDKGVGAKSLSLKRQPAPEKEVTDAAWMEGLKQDIAYRHIDIPAEFSKWQRWCNRHRKKPTQARFEAWLNRIEPPVTAPAANETHHPKGENVW